MQADELAPMILAHGVTRRFGVLPALDGVSFSLARGSVAGVLGPNGAGKSTLLRVLATLVRPDGGMAGIGGLDVVGRAAEVRRRVGYVGHAAALYPFLTVEENVRFLARIHGVSPGRDVLEETLAAAGLAHRRHAPARTLSRGLAQRLALACARLHEPQVLLLDEPHTGLDPRAADDLDDVLREMSAAGHTVMVATHDLARAHALTDRLLVLRAGRVAWDLPTADVSAADIAALVGGAPGSGLAGSRATNRRAPVPARPAPAVPGAATAAKDDDAATPTARSGAETRAVPGPGFGDTVAAVLWKDVIVELRAREVVPPVLVFALLMVVVFEFAMPASSVARQPLAAGALWVALLFGSTLGLSRLVAGEADTGGFEALLASPADRGAMFAGKWVAGYLFSVTVAAVLLPALVALLGVRVSIEQMAALAGVVALGLVGWVAAGVLIASMAAATRAREVLLPVLLYPMVLPLIVPAVQASGRILAGDPQDLPEALALVAAYDVIFWTLGFLLFGRALED